MTERRLRRSDPEFYKNIGALGGKASKTGGFYNKPQLAKTTGRKGGRVKTAKLKKEEA